MRTHLDNLLINNEKFHKDGYFYFTRKINDRFILVYETQDEYNPSCRNLGIYDKEAKEFVVVFGWAFNRLDDRITKDELRKKVNELINEEWKQYFSFQKVPKRGALNDLNDQAYIDEIKRQAINHIERGTVPELKLESIEISYNTIDEYLLEILEDPNDFAYEFVENKMTDLEMQKQAVALIMHNDILAKMEEIKNDKTNPLVLKTVLLGLSNSPQYQSYNIVFKNFDGMENHSFKIKKQELLNYPAIAIKEITYRKKPVFSADEYQIKITDDDWLDVIKAQGSLLYLTTELRKDKKFLSKVKNINLYKNHIDKSILNDKKFVLTICKNNRISKEFFNDLDDSLKEDEDIAKIFLEQNCVECLSGDVIQKTLGHALAFTSVKQLNCIFEHHDLSFKGAEISFIDRANNNGFSVNSYSLPFNKSFIEKIEDVNMAIALIKTENFIVSQSSYFQAHILNDDKFISELTLKNVGNHYLNRGEGNIEELYKKLNSVSISNDLYICKMFDFYDMCHLKTHINSTIGMNEFDNRDDLQRLIINGYRGNYHNLKLCKVNLLEDEMMINPDRAITIYAYSEKIPQDFLVTFLSKYPNKINDFINAIDVDTLRKTIAAEPKVLTEINQYNLVRHIDKFKVFAEYRSVIKELFECCYWYSPTVLKTDEDFLIENLKLDPSAIIYIPKASAYHLPKSVLDSKTFVEKYLEEFPDHTFDFVEHLAGQKITLLKDVELQEKILMNDINAMEHFNRTVYNNETLVKKLLDNGISKADLLPIMKSVGAKKDIIAMLSN